MALKKRKKAKKKIASKSKAKKGYKAKSKVARKRTAVGSQRKRTSPVASKRRVARKPKTVVTKKVVKKKPTQFARPAPPRRP